MLALLTLARPLLPYLAGLLILGGWSWFCYHRGVEGEKREFDAFVAAQREATARLKSDWNAERAKAELAALRAAEHRNENFNPIFTRVHDLPPSIRRIPVPADIVRVLDDAISAANSTGPAPEPEKPAAAIPQATDLGALTDWGVAAAEWAAMCADRVHSWESFYTNLRSAQ